MKERQDPGFAVQIPGTEFAGIFRIADVSQASSKRMLLREDGKELSDTQGLDNTATNLGQGRYFVWQRNTLVFTTSDNSDPRFNGRSYELRAPISIHPLIFLVMGAIVIWSGIVATRFGRSPSIQGKHET